MRARTVLVQDASALLARRRAVLQDAGRPRVSWYPSGHGPDVSRKLTMFPLREVYATWPGAVNGDGCGSVPLTTPTMLTAVPLASRVGSRPRAISGQSDPARAALRRVQIVAATGGVGVLQAPGHGAFGASD